MTMSNCMASIAAVACSSQVLPRISLHSGHPSAFSSQKSLSAVQLAVGRSRNEGGFNRVITAARRNEKDAGMGELEEEDKMELEFGRMLGESPDQTLKKILIRKHNPSLNYVDIEKIARGPDMKSRAWSFSVGDVSDVAVADRRQTKDPLPDSEGDLPELLRPLSRPNTYSRPPHDPIGVAALPRSEAREPELDLSPKPMRIKQKSSGIPPPRPELKIIPPVMIQRKQDVSENQHIMETTPAGLLLRPPSLIKSPHYAPKVKQLQSVAKHDTSHLLRKPLIPLLGQTEVQAPKGATQQQQEELMMPKEVTIATSIGISQTHLNSIDENYHSQSMSAKVHEALFVEGTLDHQESRFAEENDLPPEKIGIENAKPSKRIGKPTEKLEDEVGVNATTTADAVAHSSEFLKECEPMAYQNPAFVDGGSEQHLEEKNGGLEERISLVREPSVSSSSSHDCHALKQVSPAVFFDMMLRKPALDLEHRKTRDIVADEQILDIAEGMKGDLFSGKNTIGISELKDKPSETSGGSKQQKSGVSLPLEGNVQYLTRQLKLKVLPSLGLPPQKRPDYNGVGQYKQPANSANENEDRDWARIEALKCTNATVEVKLTSSNSGGMLALVDSVVGFLPAKELCSKRGLRSFAVWAREKGYSIPPGKLTQDTKQASAEFGDGHGHHEPHVEVVKPDGKEVQKVEEGSLPPQDGKRPVDHLQILYRKEKAEFLASLIGQEAKVVVTFTDRNTRRVLLSEAKAYDDSSDVGKKKADLMGKLKVGDVVTCTVKSFASFGIFVDLDGVSAFIHQSELSWNPKLKASSFLHIDQEIQAVVADLNHNLQRINLSIKRLQRDPLLETLESLSAVESDFTPDVFDSAIVEEKGTVVPELGSLYSRLEESKEISQVLKGRRIRSNTFAPNFQVYLSTPLDGGYKLLARFGNEVQEVFVKSDADKETVKQIISSSTLFDEG